MALTAAVPFSSSTVDQTPISINGKISKEISNLAHLTGLDESEIIVFPCLAELRQMIDDYNLSCSSRASENLKENIERLLSSCENKKYTNYTKGLSRFLKKLNFLIN